MEYTIRDLKLNYCQTLRYVWVDHSNGIDLKDDEYQKIVKVIEVLELLDPDYDVSFWQRIGRRLAKRYERKD